MDGDELGVVEGEAAVGEADAVGPVVPQAVRITATKAAPIADLGTRCPMQRQRVCLPPGYEDHSRRGAAQRTICPVSSVQVIVVGAGPAGLLQPHAVIAATGYSHGLEGTVGHLGVLTAGGRPVFNAPAFHPSADGLFFIGCSNPISGNLREIAMDARRLGRVLAERAASASAAA